MPSTAISTYVYDPERSTLRVKFVSGLVYDYLDVPVEVYQSMRQSYSKGSFLNRYVKGQYAFRKIESPEADDDKN